MALRTPPVTDLLASLHDRSAGVTVGLTGRSRQNLMPRQALGFELEVQVQNIE